MAIVRSRPKKAKKANENHVLFILAMRLFALIFSKPRRCSSDSNNHHYAGNSYLLQKHPTGISVCSMHKLQNEENLKLCYYFINYRLRALWIKFSISCSVQSFHLHLILLLATDKRKRAKWKIHISSTTKWNSMTASKNECA